MYVETFNIFLIVVFSFAMFASYSDLHFVVDEMNKTEAGRDTVDLSFKQLKKLSLPNLRLSHLKQGGPTSPLLWATFQNYLSLRASTG